MGFFCSCSILDFVDLGCGFLCFGDLGLVYFIWFGVICVVFV
jgi:hypothetical protein